MKIQLGTISVIHETWLPYAAGCLISYCNKIPEIKNKFTFLEPLYKYKPLEEYNQSFNQTDIFGLTCYVWNQAYNDQLMQHYKSINPKGITMYGGPNVPEDPKLAQKFADERPWTSSWINLRPTSVPMTCNKRRTSSVDLATSQPCSPTMSFKRRLPIRGLSATNACRMPSANATRLNP